MTGTPTVLEREVLVHALMLQATCLLNWGVLGGENQVPICGVAEPAHGAAMSFTVEGVLQQVETHLQALEVRVEIHTRHGYQRAISGSSPPPIAYSVAAYTQARDVSAKSTGVPVTVNTAEEVSML